MKKIIVLGSLAILTLSGCGSMATFKNQSDAQKPTVLKEFNGKYAVVGFRGVNASKVKEIELSISSENKGTASVYAENGKKLFTSTLYNCDIANQAQAENTGKPVESIENIVRCDVASSDYKYAQLYVARVKGDYVIKDQAMISTYEPMKITGGHLIEIKLSPGTGILVNASKN